MTLWDWIALGVFFICWLFYEPVLHSISRRSGAITRDMEVIRLAWMNAMTRREMRMVDSQLMGHAINSASFFGSASLILIAAVAGALFGGKGMLPDVSGLGVQVSAERLEIKLALVIICLSRGLLDFIWSIRQQNYCLALIGAAPSGDGPQSRAFAEAAAEVMNPALTAFSRGVRGYYFALAAAAWVYGAAWLAMAAVAATALLVWRQSRSPAAQGLRKARAALEQVPPQRRRKNSSLDEFGA
ncbi:MAG: DUF599 family protein [Caulobacteraceae bacterium]|nr:DUF599 family protein [Caulobacteraceae bacterium]